MAWTPEEIDALDNAFKSGASSVRKADGSQVVWRSVDEYIRLRSLAQTDIASASSTAPIRRLQIRVDSGY